MEDRDTGSADNGDHNGGRALAVRRKWTARLVIAAIFGLGFFAMLGILVFHEIPQGNREVLITLLGGLSGSTITIIAFYFGDSETNAER